MTRVLAKELGRRNDHGQRDRPRLHPHRGQLRADGQRRELRRGPRAHSNAPASPRTSWAPRCSSPATGQLLLSPDRPWWSTAAGSSSDPPPQQAEPHRANSEGQLNHEGNPCQRFISLTPKAPSATSRAIAGDSVMETAVRNGVPGIVGRMRRLAVLCHLPRLRPRGRPRHPAADGGHGGRDALRHRRGPPGRTPGCPAS